MRLRADDGGGEVMATEIKREHGPLWCNVCGRLVLGASVFNVATHSVFSSKYFVGVRPKRMLPHLSAIE